MLGLQNAMLYFTVSVLSSCRCHERLLQTITRHGYPAELHHITTEDGYILSVPRIPAPNKPAILLFHGLLSSSADWTVQGRDKSLAFIAFDAGYDVWLANNRGNTFSKAHVNLSTRSREYWMFSMHEIGYYDLAATVDHVLNRTNHSTVHYAGHSQGAAILLVLCSMRPEYNEKFSSVHLLAPAALLHHATTPAFSMVHRMKQIEGFAKITNRYEVLGRGDGSYADMLYAMHRAGFVPTDLIMLNIQYFVGHHDSINKSLLGNILEHTPAGMSVYQLLHFGQNILAKSFRMFNYGERINWQRYESADPPPYPLQMVTVPVCVYYSESDNFVPPEDVETLAATLDRVTLLHKIPVPEWNHIDYLYDTNAALLYHVIIEQMKNATR